MGFPKQAPALPTKPPSFLLLGSSVETEPYQRRSPHWGHRSRLDSPPSFLGCVWLQICGNPAAFFTRLHRQVLDLLDWPEGQMKFETRHSPHTPGLPNLYTWYVYLLTPRCVHATLTRIIHERFCCNRRSAATTSLQTSGLRAPVSRPHPSLPHSMGEGRVGDDEPP